MAGGWRNQRGNAQSPRLRDSDITRKEPLMVARSALIAAAIACVGLAPLRAAQDDGAKAPAAGSSAIRAPSVIADPGTFAVIIMPDLLATLGRFEDAAEIIAP